MAGGRLTGDGVCGGTATVGARGVAGEEGEAPHAATMTGKAKTG
jgi:hypothetical protein